MLEVSLAGEEVASMCCFVVVRASTKCFYEKQNMTAKQSFYEWLLTGIDGGRSGSGLVDEAGDIGQDVIEDDWCKEVLNKKNYES